MEEIRYLVFIEDPIIVLSLSCFILFLVVRKVGYILGLYCSSSYLFPYIKFGQFNFLHVIFISLLIGTVMVSIKRQFRITHMLYHKPNVFLIAFFVILCVNYLALTKDIPEGWNKVKYFFYFSLFPVMVIQMAFDVHDRIKEFILGYIISCVIVSAITFLYIEIDPSKRMFLIGNPITFSIPIATSCIFLLYYFLSGKIALHYKFVCVTLIGVMVFLTIMSGTRQSLFSLLVSFLGFAYLQREHNESRIQKVFIWCGLCFFLLSLPDITASLGVYDRFTTDILSPETGISVRTMYWSMAFNDFLDSPLVGIGLGSFGDYVTIPGIGVIKESEHNLLLEILAEVGLIGFCIFSIYFVLCLKSGLQTIREGNLRDKSLTVLFLCTVVFAFSQSMFSGGIVSSGNLLWSTSTLVVISRAHNLSFAKKSTLESEVCNHNEIG